MLYFTYPHADLINTDRTQYTKTKDCLLVCDLLHNICSCTVLTLDNLFNTSFQTTSEILPHSDLF